jgi:hypothetical protein
VIGADPGEQPRPFGHRQGRAVHVGQAERDVPGGLAAGQLAELVGAGDVEVSLPSRTSTTARTGSAEETTAVSMASRTISALA